MRVNYKELGFISLNWNSNHEGILLVKRKCSRRKKEPSFTEHWCRLKGNILLFCQTCDKRCTDISELAILEEFKIQKCDDEEVPHAFRLDFSSGDPSLILVGRSASEARDWILHLEMAPLIPLLHRIVKSREELRTATGVDPLETCYSTGQENNPPLSLSDPDPTGVELNLCGENLIATSNGSFEPNFRIIVSICTPPETGWSAVASTEVVEKSINPNFLTVIYIRSAVFTETTRVRFTLVDLCDINSSIGVKFGCAITMISDLIEKKDVTLKVVDTVDHLPLPPPASGGPSPSIRVRTLRYSTDHLDTKKPDANMLQLRAVCDNILSKHYQFRHTRGEPMHVVELIGESKLCFTIPMTYLKFLIESQTLLLDSIKWIGSSNPLVESFRKERQMTMNLTLKRYKDLLVHAANYAGYTFKPSVDRGNPRYDLIPTNLHVNQIATTDVNAKTVSSHTILTVGVFSTASLGYKSGGLLRLAYESMTSLASSQYPHVQATWNEFIARSPIASMACELGDTRVGRYQALLQHGAATMAVLRDSLVGLVYRLTARDQARLLAEKIGNTLDLLEKILSDLALEPTARCVTPMKEYFDSLHVLLVRLSTLDALESASPPMPPSSERNHRKASMHASAETRADLLSRIQAAGESLTDRLNRLWNVAAESLWTSLLTDLLSLVKQETPTAGASVEASIPSACALSQSAVISSAESWTNGNPPVAVDNYLTALSVLCDTFAYRYHACVSQAITALLTGLAVAIPKWGALQWKHITVCGLLVQFEGLISCFGNEAGMVEDWIWAVQQLPRFRIIVRPSCDSVQETDPETSTASTAYESATFVKMTSLDECQITVPWSSWKSAPSDIQALGHLVLKICPVCFLVGINEQQTLAEKFDRTALQKSVNQLGLAALEAYFKSYTRSFRAPPRTLSKLDVCDLLVCLRHLLTPPIRDKPVEILELAAEFTMVFDGIRFTSCKSAKDRTAMSVTLEQVRWLHKSEGMLEDDFQPALQCLRRTGLRLEIARKNSGVPKYSFNRLQLFYFPKLYRPPVGTFTSNIVS